jgi:hypothetical protein
MIAVLLLTLGFQILLAAIGIDLHAAPREPISRGPIIPVDVLEDSHLIGGVKKDLKLVTQPFVLR